MPKVAILITTFLRDELLYKTVQSVVDNLPNDCIILIGDQNPSQDKHASLEDPDKGVYYYELPYDCGLSYSRNFLVSKAKEMQIPFCLVSADSIQFTDKYNLEPHIRFLEEQITRSIVGFNIKDRINWEFYLRLDEGEAFILVVSKDEQEFEGISYKKVHICRNFFLGKTEVLSKIQWDNNLKLMEHQDWFWRVKEAGYEVFYTEDISSIYIDCKPPEYLAMRSRMYNEFIPLFLLKYNIRQWIKYGKGVEFTK